MTKRDIARQYRDKYGLEMCTNQLAAIIHKENKKIFQTQENARYALRGIEGKSGNKYRLKKKNLEYIVKNDRSPVYKEQVETPAKVLIIDIETAPIKSYTWGIWNQNVATSQIISDWFCLTWAAKWLFEDKVYSGKLTPKEIKNENDGRIIKSIWQLFNQADIIIAHNAEKFDIPKLNSRFILNNLQPPLPYQTIDTLKHIRRNFGFTSNKLDYVNKLLNLPRKKENSGMQLWIDCLKGSQDAINEMEVYNIQDVRILEETYLNIRSWIKPHPNMGLYIMDGVTAHCPSCGSDKLKAEGKMYYTSVNRYEVFRCDNCGATGRQRKAADSINTRRALVTATAK